ncbi:MAG: hypothetical protein IIB12_06885, partial [Chloroflexi bacterium]|nr:hypothetical protein [Chloroflexota bacterium]
MTRIVVVMLVLVATLGLLATTVSAQGGVTVFFGDVTIDGAAAPAGTQVEIVLPDGTVIGTSTTGAGGLAPDQYRVDIQANASFIGQTVSIRVVGSDPGSAATATFASNRAISRDIA